MSIINEDRRDTSPGDDADEPLERAADTPQRDGRGRFAGGSHNPGGRPKKVQPPTSMGEALARALAEPVTVTIKGKATKLKSYEAFARKLVQTMLVADPINAARLARMMLSLKAFDELRDQQMTAASEESGNVWTEELEAQYQAVEAAYACNDEVDTASPERRDLPPEEEADTGAAA
jgi:hypothetical protein